MIVSLPVKLKRVKSPSPLQEAMTITLNGFNTLMHAYNNLINKAKFINYLHEQALTLFSKMKIENVH